MPAPTPLTIAVVTLALGLGACAKSQSTTIDDPRSVRDTAIVLEDCEVSEEASLDANGDGRPDVVRKMDGEREVCRRVDLNMDGKFDRSTFFDDAGRVTRIESDFDKDGVVDEIALYEGGELREKHQATVLDGRIDTWKVFQQGRVVSAQRDTNGDAVVDQWWEFPRPDCPLIHTDADGDGRPDPGASIDYCRVTGAIPELPDVASPPDPSAASEGQTPDASSGDGAPVGESSVGPEDEAAATAAEDSATAVEDSAESGSGDQ